MKKMVLCLFIIGFPVTVWGHNIGFSLFLSPDFGGGFETQTTFSGKKMGTSLPMSYIGGGFSFYYDIKYLEVSAGLLFGNGQNKGMFVSSPILEVSGIGGDFGFTAVNLGLMGKYPFGYDIISTYPLLGIEYNAVFLTEIDGKKVDKPGDWNQLWFKFGWGLDIDIKKTSPTWYIRGGLLYGFRLPTKMERDSVEETKKQMERSFYPDLTIPDITSRFFLGQGITLKIAFGYKF
jgi:hypothetical protein